MKRLQGIMQDVKLQTEHMKTIREIALDSLREAIITGALQPGDQLRERELAEMMGISTTPIKEVLRILTNEGLVTTIPRKGTYVSEMVNSSIEEVLLLKASVEGLIARLAASKITGEALKQLEQQLEYMAEMKKFGDAESLLEANKKFHQLIQQAADNPMISHVSNHIQAFDQAFRKRALKMQYEVEQGFNEHRAIYDAIRTGNVDLAEHSMKEHITRTIKNVLKK